MAGFKLIGISGTNGAGKDTVAKMLADDHGWLFISGSDLLRDELKKSNTAIERKNLRILSAQLRREHGLGVLIDKAVKLFEPKKDNFKGLVISSLRNPGEADRVHALGGFVVWVDAEPKVRYQRVATRKRSAEDQKSFRQFLAEEQDELHYSGDAATLSLAGVKEKADIFIDNQTNDIEVFKKDAAKALRSIMA